MRLQRLTREEADAVEAEMRQLEGDPSTTLRAMRLFMQAPMPCGHAAGNLLTCPDPPFGCVICNGVTDREHEARVLAEIRRRGPGWGT